MSLIMPLQILSVIAQDTAYLASLSWLAWRSERARGDDAFHLVIAFASAVWFLSFLIDLNILPQFLVILISAALGMATDALWARMPGRIDSKYTLARVIVAASLALIIFDRATAGTPVALPVGSFGLRNPALLAAGAAWLGIIFHSRSRSGWLLRVGTGNRWAREYWSRPLPVSSDAIKVADYLCWAAVVTLPTATTGILSTTILKDVAISILVARVAAARGAMIVLYACLTLAALRAVARQAFVGNTGHPLVEATIFVCLLIWLRYRGSRTAWRELLDR
jgi:hypothetical protein